MVDMQKKHMSGLQALHTSFSSSRRSEKWLMLEKEEVNWKLWKLK